MSNPSLKRIKEESLIAKVNVKKILSKVAISVFETHTKTLIS